MTTATQEQTMPAAQPAQRQWAGLLTGGVMLVLLTLLVAELDQGIADWFAGEGVSKNPVEYPLTAVIVGLIANAVLRLSGQYALVRPAIRTELYLKIGLVVLGARISFGDLAAKGAGGLIQAVIMVIAVFSFTWWLGGRLKLPDKLRAIMSSAVSICGVSAALAAAGAVMARKEDVTYIAGLVILTALPLMVLMPWIADAAGLPDDIAGAWFGGNIDTTAAVVGAGTIHGDTAQEVATVVKLAQNVMIGFAAFFLALYFALVVERDPQQRPSPLVIWQRFPKFVIGFVLVSLLASLDLFSAELIKEMKHVYKWLFALAFICIGLELSVSELRKMGWRPLAVYLAATVFNTLLALGVAAVIFGVLGA